MGKFTLLTTLTLQAAGFDKGVDKAKKSAKALSDGVQSAGSTMMQALSPLTSAVGGLGGQFTGVATGMIGAFKKMIPAIHGVRSAIISTGIGAILIAITTAIAGLISWMKRTDEGSDAMRKAFDIVKAVINTVLEKLGYLGSALVKLFKRDFKGAAEDAKAAFTGWGSAMKENIATAKKLNDLQDKLEDYNETAALNRAKIEERISALQAKAREADKYTATEQLKLTNDLAAAKLELYNFERQGKQLELDVLREELAMDAKNQDNRQKANDKEAELINLRTTYNEGLKETIKLRLKLAEEAEREKKREEDTTTGMVNTVTAVAEAVGSIPNLFSGMFNTMKTDLAEMNMEIAKTATLADKLKEGLRPVTEKIGEGLKEGADSFKEYGKVVKSTVKSIIGAMIAEGVSAMVMSALKDWATKVPFGYIVAPAAAGLAAGLAKTAFNSLIPKFATGGIVSSPTMAMVGDYSNARSNPEVIAPLDRLQRLIGGGYGGEVTFRIEGDTLVGVLNNKNRRFNSFK